MKFTPLTESQYNKARESFSHDDIMNFETQRKAESVQGTTTGKGGNAIFDVQTIATPQLTSAQKTAKGNADTAQYQKEADKANSFMGMAGNFGKALVSNIASSEVGLGNTISKVFGNQASSYSDSSQQLSDAQYKLAKVIQIKEKQGEDVTRLKQSYNELDNQRLGLEDQLNQESNLPTNGEAIGQLGGTALDVLTAGTYGKAAAGMKSGVLANMAGNKVKNTAIATGAGELGQIATNKASGLFTKQGAMNVAKGAGLGYAGDVTQGLQGNRGEDRTGGSAFIPGLGTAIGAGIPLATELTQSVKNRLSPEYKTQKIQNELSKLDSNNAVKNVVLKGKERGIDIKKQVAESGVLHGSVDNTGNISTKGDGGAVEQYTKKYIDGNEKIVSDLLKKEGKSIPLEKVRITLENSVNNSNLEGKELEQAHASIASEMAGLTRRSKATGTIPVETLHNAKMSKYNGINFMTDSDTATYKKTIAKAFKGLVEDNTSSADIKAINQELSKHFSVIDYLNKLDNKKVEGGRLGKLVWQGVGAAIGGHFGPAGAYVGSEIGSRGKGISMAQNLKGNANAQAIPSELMNKAKDIVNKKPLNLPAGK